MHSLYGPVMTQLKKRAVFPPRLLKSATVESEEDSRGRSVAVAVGCLLFAIQRKTYVKYEICFVIKLA